MEDDARADLVLSMSSSMPSRSSETPNIDSNEPTCMCESKITARARLRSRDPERRFCRRELRERRLDAGTDVDRRAEIDERLADRGEPYACE
jgi:hypothetical protein